MYENNNRLYEVEVTFDPEEYAYKADRSFDVPDIRMTEDWKPVQTEQELIDNLRRLPGMASGKDLDELMAMLKDLNYYLGLADFGIHIKQLKAA